MVLKNIRMNEFMCRKQLDANHSVVLPGAAGPGCQ